MHQFEQILSVFVVAVLLGLMAAALTTIYVTNYRKNVQHGQQDVGVLVAATDIPAGTSGAAIVSGHMLAKKTIPRTALVPGAISSPDQIARLVSTQEVMIGEQVTKSQTQTMDHADEALESLLLRSLNRRSPRPITFTVEWQIHDRVLQETVHHLAQAEHPSERVVALDHRVPPGGELVRIAPRRGGSR